MRPRDAAQGCGPSAIVSAALDRLAALATADRPPPRRDRPVTSIHVDPCQIRAAVCNDVDPSPVPPVAATARGRDRIPREIGRGVAAGPVGPPGGGPCRPRSGRCRTTRRSSSVAPRNSRPVPRRPRLFREVGTTMDGRTAQHRAARAPEAHEARRTGPSVRPACFNPRRPGRRTAVDGNFPSNPSASATRPASRPTGLTSGEAPPGPRARRTTSAAMPRVRHGQQNADRRDAPGGDPGRHGPRV